MSNLPLTAPDLVCGLDLDPFASETTSDLQSLSQDVLHILLQDLGSNPDDPNRGIGIYNYLGGTADELAKLPGRIDAQLRDDDRITSCSTTINIQSDGSFIVAPTIYVGDQVVPLEFQISQAGVVIL